MAHKVFALILDGIVKNVIVGDYVTCDRIAKMTYGNIAFANEVTNIPVQINDTYADGYYFRGGVLIEAMPTTQEQVTSLLNVALSHSQTIDDILVALLEVSEN